MRRAAIAGVLVLAPGVRAQEPPAPKPAPAWRTEQRDVRIPMRDGQALAADVYLPPARGRYPAILIQTPYNKRGLGAPIAGRAGRRGSPGPGLFDRDHYAYVVVDWRGFYGSRDAKTTGKPDRGADGYDCVEWTAAQPWCNGRVGTWGPSALGKVQYDTARAQPPHLVCGVPVIAAMGQQCSFYLTGGVLREAHVKSLDRLGFGLGRVVDRTRDRPGVWRFARRRTYRPEQIQIPLLLITGWWDHYPDEILQTFADLKRRGGEATRAHSKLLIGPWDHMSVGKTQQGDWRFPAAAPENRRSVRAFFDYWLRDQKDNGWAETATVRYWRINEPGWHDADGWPGVAVETQTRHLHPDGSLRTAAVAGAGPQARTLAIDPHDLPPTLGGANLPPLRHGPVDQAPLAERDDVLIWDTPPLPEPLRIAGRVRLRLACRSDAASFDIAVRCCILGDDGRAMLLGDTIQRVAGAPGATHTIALHLPATAATVPAGARLRLIVSGGNHPRYEKNPALTAPATVTVAPGTGTVAIPVAAPK